MTPDLPPDVSADDADILWTDAGRPFVRTPDECFADLPDYPWEPRYAEVDGMRMHYVEAGDPNGEVVLLLHGQPDWSYLYRSMIPLLAASGNRVIAPDFIGFGKSDKPVQLADYRFLQHVAWTEEFIDVLGLDGITPVVQDWGSLIGLRCVGNRPDLFARIVVANGNLLVEGHRSTPRLVLLDHGSYARLSDTLRRDYNRLWSALLHHGAKRAEMETCCRCASPSRRSRQSRLWRALVTPRDSVGWRRGLEPQNGWRLRACAPGNSRTM